MAKNILGTFTPPARIMITTRVLATLSQGDWRSGIGEMLKVHAIAGPAEFAAIARDYNYLLTQDAVMRHYIRKSLEIKKTLIEVDEFDRGPRNIMNYGHTFGHAIEVATAFSIPHGIAVTIGMDMANYVAFQLSIAPESHFQRMHEVLKTNYLGFEQTPVPLEGFLAAIAKDKKNTDRELSLILPDQQGFVKISRHPADSRFIDACACYLSSVFPL
jgi:3-dehydroquinate synthase